MTRLQSLAFERIEELNKFILNCLPKQFDLNVDFIELNSGQVESIINMLHEQQEWIDALNREEHS